MRVETNGTTAADRAGIADITLALATNGIYRVTLDQAPAQALVDLQWDALRAGRLLGIKVSVHIARLKPEGDRHAERSAHDAVTVTITRRTDPRHRWT